MDQIALRNDINNIKNNINLSNIEKSKMQLMSSIYQTIKVGDIVESSYGELIVLSIDDDIYRGNLLWQFKNPVLGSFTKKDLTKKINIFCADCEKESKSKYHFIGNECSICNGFNTSIID